MSIDLKECLPYIPAAALSYQEWINVGMALKREGYSPEIWENWSAADLNRYHAGECRRKWSTFQEDAIKLVTGGTIVQMAKERGFVPAKFGNGEALGWGEAIIYSGQSQSGIVDKNWLEGQEVTAPDDKKWNPATDMITYLETLFQPTEYVGYVTESSEKEGRFVPANKGVYVRSAGEIVEALRKNSDVALSIGDYNQVCGAWVRFNPLDGKGVKNANVTNFRFCLIESDSLSIEKQNALIRELELPVAALVHSGGKSLHAIVRIEAKDYAEYRSRVDFLYRACEKNGLALDKQNRNPSRLSRLPGVMRAGKKQFLVDTNIGKKTYAEWLEWYEEQDDDLPNFENLADVWDNMPPLAPPLIDGILRQGHKMLISGPSKAGKSFAQIELAVAIAEGVKWFGWPCTKGRVLYVNFELDTASCFHRFRDVYARMGLNGEYRSSVDIWNLRGKSMQLDKLAPKLIRRAKKTKPLAIILDPIYKTLTGDENSAEQMAIFCNQFDRVCSEVGCSVIYCHHHSKGAQGGKKAMDRASGSGVFARDPDALLDLIELPLKESNYEFLKNKAACKAIIEALDKELPKGWREDLGPDDFLSKAQLDNYAKENLSDGDLYRLGEAVKTAEKHAEHITAWRIDCTLREYEKPDTRDVYFAWPVHIADESGALKDIRPEIEVGGRIIQPKAKSDGNGKKDKAKEERQLIIDTYTLIAAAKEPDEDGAIRVTVQDFVENAEEYFGREMKRASMYKKIRKYGDFDIEGSIVTPANFSENEED